MKPKGRTTATTPEVEEGVRLQKFLASAGIASRRESEKIIQGGRVEVNGATVTVLGSRVDPMHDVVRVDGQRVHPTAHRVAYLLYKPRGFITTASDPEGRPTVLELVRGVSERVFPVGRLDWNSEGLLILTNDGDLANRLTHPSNHIPKVYRVKVKGQIPPAALDAARKGIVLEGQRSRPAEVRRVASQIHTWIEVTLHEGRKNQIRRIFEKLGHPVLKLRRIAIGPINDRNLKPGQFRRLTDGEILRLRGKP